MSNYTDGDIVYVEYIDDDNDARYFAKVLGVDEDSGKVVLNDVLIVYEASGQNELIENYKLPPEFIIHNFKDSSFEVIKDINPSLFL